MQGVPGSGSHLIWCCRENDASDQSRPCHFTVSVGHDVTVSVGHDVMSGEDVT
jgi:hypothetical protein